MKIMINILLIMSPLYIQSDTAINDQRPKPNHLIHATSPYLLQHAYNPVNWYEWGTESLEKAKKENKPILVSIGYSSCHWCHVMAHECFENKDIAAIMNENFINIKVDREERPDIDQVYMSAVQAMGISGGWPLNVFITPDQKPFFGGTYFPPKQWAQVLTQVAGAYRKEYSKIDRSAEALAKHLAKSELASIPHHELEGLDDKDVRKMYTALTKKFDSTWGGMAKAPKFVMPAQWLFLLRYYHESNDDKALRMVTLTLSRMAMGGLYDQIGGGFARYSVDNRWFAPHFEKMLYDNAQLLKLYSEVYAITHTTRYKRVVYETIDWLEREMTDPGGGFYSAINADSEGEEGKFYVWQKKEFDSLLRNQPSWINDYYSVSEEGNWEHGNNILFIRDNDQLFIKKHTISQKQLDATIDAARAILQRQREKRIKPSLDDKILTGWNAMMIDGLLHAYRTFGEPRWLTLAQNSMRFIEKHLLADNVYRSFKGKRSPVGGFLEDYAWLIQAYIGLYQVTFDESWIKKATRWAAYTQEHFFDEAEGFYTFSAKNSTPLIANKKEIFDNVIPASNGVMARNMYQLGILLDNESYKNQAIKMVSRLRDIIRSEPSYMSNWGILYAEITHGMAEVVIVGKKYKKVLQALQKNYTPFALFMGTPSTSTLPLIKDKAKQPNGGTTIYVCFDKVCKRPVHTTEKAMEQLQHSPPQR